MGCVGLVSNVAAEPERMYEKCPVGKLKIHFYSIAASC